jgi:hypothetical protein
MGSVPPESAPWRVVNTKQCKSCGSQNLARFTGEVAIRLPGLKNIDAPPVFVFPEFAVCTVCGVAWFVVPSRPLRSLEAGRNAPES